MTKRQRCINCGGVMVNAYISVHRKMQRYGLICKRCDQYLPPLRTDIISIGVNPFQKETKQTQ